MGRVFALKYKAILTKFHQSSDEPSHLCHDLFIKFIVIVSKFFISDEFRISDISSWGF